MRIFLFVVFFVVIALAKEPLPQTFATMATPLYEASEHFEKIAKDEKFQKELDSYKTFATQLRHEGLRVDTTEDKKQKFAYLKELRKLQKKYDYLLYLLHNNIYDAITRNDYERFANLIRYRFDGFLEQSALLEKALSFYNKHKHTQKIALLESMQQKEQLIEESFEELQQAMEEAEYHPDAKTTKKRSVYISSKATQRGIDVYFTNNNLYDVTLNVSSRYNNIKESRYFPKEFVLKAKQTRKFAHLSFVGNDIPSYSYRYRWVMGSVDAQHNDNYLYRFPYKSGSAYRISQGYNGTQTHKGRSRYAIDFVMPRGTKIYAARGGVVVKTKSDSNQGGFDKKYRSDGNYVTIMHDDGTFATYYHLKQNGVLVNVGTKVAEGEAIGYSGTTGYSSGPHLHFAVFKAQSATYTQTLPTRFKSAQGIIKEPKKGQAYKAQ